MAVSKEGEGLGKHPCNLSGCGYESSALSLPLSPETHTRCEDVFRLENIPCDFEI